MTALVQDVTIGWVRLHEVLAAPRLGTRGGVAALRVSGEESSPGIDGLTAAQVDDRIRGILALAEFRDPVPVTFDTESVADAWARVVAVDVSPATFTNVVRAASWSVDLEVVAHGTARLGQHFRDLMLGASPTRWWAPPAGATGIDAGTGVVPSKVSRSLSTGGTIDVWTGVGSVSPWSATVAPSGWAAGGVTVSADGTTHPGRRGTIPAASSVVLENGVTRVTVDLTAGWTFRVETWGGTAWESATTFDVDVGATAVAGSNIDRAELVAWRPDEAAIRLWTELPTGVTTTVGLSLRRGARLVGVTARTGSAANLAVGPTTGTGTASGTYVVSADDGSGNAWMVGSSTATVGASGVSATAATTIAAYAGLVNGGSGAGAGDTAADLDAQARGAAILGGVTVR